MSQMSHKDLSAAVRYLKGLQGAEVESAIEKMSLTASERAAVKSAFNRSERNNNTMGMWD